MEFRTLENVETKNYDFLDKVEKEEIYGPFDVAFEKIHESTEKEKSEHMCHVAGYRLDLFDVDHWTSEIEVLCGVENGMFYKYSDKWGKEDIKEEDAAKILLDFLNEHLAG